MNISNLEIRGFGSWFFIYFFFEYYVEKVVVWVGRGGLVYFLSFFIGVGINFFYISIMVVGGLRLEEIDSRRGSRAVGFFIVVRRFKLFSYI